MTISNDTSLISTLMEALPTLYDKHAPGTAIYKYLSRTARSEIERLFSNVGSVDFAQFGEIDFPYFSMGNVDSLSLFDLDELIIFSFYNMHRNKYKNALDIGANIGLHTIILARCGFKVRSFEPDPIHFNKLSENSISNQIVCNELINAAISSKGGSAEFVRVKGNTTGSHITGSKESPYGELDRFTVDIVPISNHLAWADFVKLDAEGHEKEIIMATALEDWYGKDAMVEFSSQENAQQIFNFFNGSKITLYSQKINWDKVNSVDDMPFSHHDGSLFISGTGNHPWR